MSLKRLKYGIEYDPSRAKEDGESSGIGWILVLVFLVAAVSYVVHVVRRITNESSPDGDVESVLVVESLKPPEPRVPETNGVETVNAQPVVVNDFSGRPAAVQNLLLRLEQASKRGDIENQIATIERLRFLPGEPVADIDDSLVRKLGELNVHSLFVLANPRWVTEVKVRGGDTAMRIAREHGSTFASLKRLNPRIDVDRLRVGQTIRVMDHPSFGLVVHKRLKAIDLNLNGKLFKRYMQPDDAPEIPWPTGSYVTPAKLKEYLKAQGVVLDPSDAAELDMLLPARTRVNVSAT